MWTFKTIITVFPIGFLAGLMLMGLMGLYGRLPEETADMLRALTVVPPILLGIFGLLISLLIPDMWPCHSISALLTLCGLGLAPTFGRAGGALLVSAATPYVLMGLFCIIISF